MILVAIGANLSSPRFGPPLNTCEAALKALENREISVVCRSPWYRSAPVPTSDQPDFVNGVVCVETGLSPADLLDALHDIERDFGRVRGEPNAARVIDLDLIAYDERVIAIPGGLAIPHPRLQDRAFVLYPLRDVAPGWRHPVSGRSVDDLIAALPPGQHCVVLGQAGSP